MLRSPSQVPSSALRKGRLFRVAPRSSAGGCLPGPVGATGTGSDEIIPDDTGATEEVPGPRDVMQCDTEPPSAQLGLSDLPKLSSVFAFKHLGTATDQGNPAWLLSTFQAFVQALQHQQPSTSALWADLDSIHLSNLKATVQLLKNPGPGLSMEWLPEFGCALLPLSPPTAAALQPDHVALYLVVPDGWTFDMHSSPAGIDQNSHISKNTWINSGAAPGHLYRTLVSAMHTIISEQQALKQEEKRKPGGRKSHFQRTPAFIQSAVQAALEEVLAAHGSSELCHGQPRLAGKPFPPPKGGFTDVGKHTGGLLKATSWPLLQSMVKALLQLRATSRPSEGPPDSNTPASTSIQQLFDQIMMHFELWIMMQLVQQLTPPTATPAAIDACITMLQSVAAKAADLAVEGVDVAAVEAACTTVRQHVEAAMTQRQLQAAAKFRLPADATPAAGTWRLPKGTLPPEYPAAAGQQGLDAAKARAAASLGSRISVTTGQSFSDLLQQLLQVLGASSGTADVAKQHGLRATERVLFSRAAAGFVEPSLSGTDAALLAQVLDSYRVVSAAFKSSLGQAASHSSAAMLRNELRSRELLVGWIVYCLIHQSAAAAHRLVLQYDVALDWQELRHLSVTDKAATDAALGASSYLKKHSKSGQLLFHLSQQNPTLRFAESFAAADTEICAMLSQHQDAASQRMNTHWKTVLRQQNQAAQLRVEIADLQSRRSTASSSQSTYDWHETEYKRLTRQISDLDHSIRLLQSQLKIAETPPPSVIQPVPRQDSLAQQWLFFMHMPALLRCLARAACLAQQLLLPPQLPSSIQVTGLQTSLPAHYNKYQASTQYHTPHKQYHGSDGAAGNVMAMSDGTVPKGTGPGHIDSYHSIEDGVWFPDSLAATMAWQGSNCPADLKYGTFFNPFAQVDSKVTVESFTAQLPSSYGSLQWAIYQYGSLTATATDRGNAGIARQEDKPGDFSKSAYLAATALRSFPHRQLHRLCEYLGDKELHLDNPAVQMLVQQALYHLGELKETSGKVLQLWRTGWDAPGGVLSGLCFELQQLASELENKPRDQRSVLLLGQMAAYLSDWHDPCKAVAKQFADMTSRFADQQLQQQIDVLVASGSEEAQFAELKAKQTHWRAMALLCFAAGPLSSDDVGNMLRLMLLIKHADVYQPDKQTAAELAALRVCCHDVMARRLPDITTQLDLHPQLLTLAAASILECLQQQPGGPRPPHLPWQRLVDHSSSSPMASYQAVGSGGHLYSINVLDGTLLFDGSPPGRLPNSILQNSLYLRTFGKSNHEVKTTADGQLETIRPIQGRFYRFNLVPGASPDNQLLMITELDPTQPDAGVLELQLLDPGADDSCPGWGDDLPVRLQKMHSHWLDRQHNVIVLRPRDFQQHAPHFIIRCSLTASDTATSTASAFGPDGSSIATHAVYSCWQVPLHLQQHHWTTVLAKHADQLSQRQLVLPDNQPSQVMLVLSKFEAQDFIHTFMHGHCPGFHNLDTGLPSPAATAKRRAARKAGLQASATSSGEHTLAATGVAVAGMTWHLPRCGLEFQLSADGNVMSLGHKGYRLSPEQLLVAKSGHAVRYTLAEYHQYLLLQAQQDPSLDSYRADRSEQLVLVPSGPVTVARADPGSKQQRASIHVQLSTVCSDHVKVFKNAVHARFGYLQAQSNTSRLQLAALYAASSTLLPEPASQLTGAATAMMLVRHSWTNEPLDTQQLQHLTDISRLGGHLAPALRLLCHDLAASASQLQHLHVPETGGGAAARHAGTSGNCGIGSSSSAHSSSPKLDPAAASEYLVRSAARTPAGFPASPRLQLTAAEESWLLHTGPSALTVASLSAPDWKKWGRYTPITDGMLLPMPVAGDYVQQAEAALKALVQNPQQYEQLPSFPLPQLDSSVPVAQEMMQELEDSWKCYQSHPEPIKVKSLESLKKGPYSQAEVHVKRSAVEAYLLHHLACVPESVGRPGRAFRLLVLSATQPAASPTDLLSLAWGFPDKFLAFNPFLTKAACAELQQGVLLWLQLCVLEDRLERVMKLAVAGDEYTPLLIRELCTYRTWEASQHPEWLVFEVEGRLQIRPAQHVLAQKLLAGGAGADGRGPIAQLNMGEGKTRVILPMMVLTLANGQHLVRVNFLSQLLHEGKAHLQQHLTASVLGRKVLCMPFHRGIKVTVQTLGAMEAALSYCQQVGGVLVMAPEHRNSMLLKYLELALSGSAGVASALLKLLEEFPYHDILDESDEVLHHHRRQLVYAWGDSIPLPALRPRMEVVQCLLLLLSKLADQGAPELNTDGLALKSGVEADRKPGSFCGLQLLSGKQLDQALPSIQQLLAEHLVLNPPMQDELAWLKNFPDQAVLVKLMISRDTCTTSLIQQHPVLSTLPADKQHQLLAARGLLACGLLVHCLQSRHRVGYGINRSPSAKKRLAVPYRAADLPSERSEFSQPDVALLYTHLSYYGDGLSKGEFKAAVQMLLNRGPSEQAYNYNRWLAQGLASGRHEAGCTSDFDSVDKVDPNNSQLMAAMWAYFSHNMEVVNYWLATCVLPQETKQYPSRLVATAWHLAQNPTGNVAGFSGTNDSHRLLPLQVQQVPLDEASELQGTNGKMLDMLIRHARYTTLELQVAGNGQATTPVWQLLLDQALILGVDAIIDCGALLAGVDYRSVADYILSHMPAGRFRGVTYFCPAVGSWVILDTHGRLSPKGSSHLQEAETLAVFDDARCRGSDLKLRQSAVGLLTLAAGMPKDKLMQAAGRLRQLGRGQTLVVTGLPDVSSKILAAAEGFTCADSVGGPPQAKKQRASLFSIRSVTSRGSSKSNRTMSVRAKQQPDMCAVLAWVMQNTVQATLAGILEAAAQGMQFAATYGCPPEACVWPERLSVEELYGSSKVVEPVPRLLSNVSEHFAAHILAKLAQDSDDPSGEPESTTVAAPATMATSGSSSGSGLSSMSVDERSSSLPSASSMSTEGGGQSLISSNNSSSSGSSSGTTNDNSGSSGTTNDTSLLASKHSKDSKTSSGFNNDGPSANGLDAAGVGVDGIVADIQAVEQRFRLLGEGHSVLAGQGADEECERELEQEEEEEQEAEVQVPTATAATEMSWDWSSAFSARCSTELRGCYAMKLSEVLRLVTSPSGVSSIAWSDKVWASHNFVHSISHSRAVASPGLSDYMRPVGALLLFPGSGELLLLSEREADALQREVWYPSPSSNLIMIKHRLAARHSPNLLLSLSYLRLACAAGNNQGTRASAPSIGQFQHQQLFLGTKLTSPRCGSPALSVSDPVQLAAWVQQKLTVQTLVDVQMFAGAVMYGSEEQRVLLHQLMRGRREAAQELVGWRGKLHMLLRSDLDRACSDDTFG